jgi:hypothetical protein
MKLYATVQSERARKGQGGNKFLRIEIAGGSAAASTHLATIHVKVEGDEVVLLTPGLTVGTVEHRFPLNAKGEKQTGECWEAHHKQSHDGKCWRCRPQQ